MGDERYNCYDIAKAVNEGDKDKVRTEINSNALRMSPSEFRAVIDSMAGIANANKDSSHHANVEKDKDGNVTAIYVTNEAPIVGNYWSSKVFDQSDLPGHSIWG